MVETFRNKEKELVFTQNRTSFCVWRHFQRDRSRNSATFKMELFSTIGNGRVYNQWTIVFACCCGN